MYKSLLIHHNNVPDLDMFDYNKAFVSSGDIDQYIHTHIIQEIKDYDFDIVYIKDSLSPNYLEFYGLLMAYHVRLSIELQDKRFVPIVILSDIDGFTLNKLNPLAKIVFTKNMFIGENNMKTVQRYNSLSFPRLSTKEYQYNFLDCIEVIPPQESSHDISNKWAIFRWADFLQIKDEDSDAIRKNKEEIINKLYFKYLLTKNPLPKKKGIRFAPARPYTSGKILYIDDEWNMGWEDIFIAYFSKINSIEFKSIKEINKNTDFNQLAEYTNTYLEKYDPDLVILDMRLLTKDEDENDPKKLSGIKLLELIKLQNPGIQVIMLTASGKSIVLDKANQYNIVGYIKKEHPEDISIRTKDNFELLKEYIEVGLERKFLKEIWLIEDHILKLKIIENKEYEPIVLEVESVFAILDSDMERKNIYASLAIFKCIEIINNIFIHEDYPQAYWKDTKIKIDKIDGKTTSPKNKIINILHKRLSLYKFDKMIIDLTKKRNHAVHASKGIAIQDDDILVWFKMLSDILEHLNRKML